MSDEYISLEVRRLRKTEAAIQVTIHEGMSEEEDIWVPKSVVEHSDVLNFKDDGNVCKIEIKKWFLDKKEIEYNIDNTPPTQGMFDGGGMFDSAEYWK